MRRFFRPIRRRLGRGNGDPAVDSDTTTTGAPDGDGRTDGDGHSRGDGRGNGDARPDGGTVAERRPSSGGRLTGALDDRFGDDFVESLPFWLPAFLLMALFVYGAIIWNFVISLTDYEGFRDVSYSSLDFEMYARALDDPGLIDAAQNTLVLVVAFTLLTLAAGLGLAILVDRNIRFENTFRTIYLLPMSLSFVVTAQFWLWLYNFDDGVINQVLVVVGLDRVNWIGDPQVVLWAVIIALMWQFSGYAMVVYLAGLRAIPREHYEAAKVDGASTLTMYRRVIVPQLKGATISAAVVLMVFALKAFDFLFSLVSGYRPPNGSDILATKMVREVYSGTPNWAYGSAIAMILFALALAIIGPYLVYQYRRGNL